MGAKGIVLKAVKSNMNLAFAASICVTMLPLYNNDALPKEWRQNRMEGNKSNDGSQQSPQTSPKNQTGKRISARKNSTILVRKPPEDCPK